MIKIIWFAACIAVLILLEAGCRTPGGTNNRPASAPLKELPVEQGSPEPPAVERKLDQAAGESSAADHGSFEPVVVGEGTLKAGNGKTETVRIRMIRGKEVTGSDPGPFQGTFLTGTFEAVIVGSDDRERAPYPLNEAFGDEEMSFRKGLPFKLRFADYNEDGHPDFAIGQWGGSNGSFYALLTVRPDGFAILESDIYSADHRESIRFRKVGDKAFVNSYYDQEKGSYMDVIHRWDGSRFRRDAPVPAKEVHPAGVEDED